jgi:hypothetical protein
MTRPLYLLAAAVAGLATLSAPGVRAEQTTPIDFPSTYVPRCQPDALRASSDIQDDCAPQIALFGLSGPTVVGSSMRDIEATGSVGRGEKRPD